MHQFMKTVALAVSLLICASCANYPSTPSQQLLANDLYGIAYSGFRDGQHPARDGAAAINPTSAQILEDLTILLEQTPFRMIRLYDSQQNSAETLKVIRQHKLPIKVLLGAWLNAEISNHEGCAWLEAPIPESQLAANKLVNQQEIQTAIALANEYSDIVVAVNVGNEALVEWNDHMVTEAQIIEYIQTVQQAIAQPVTTADNYAWWAQRGAAVADVVDFIMVHTYPQWEGKTVDQAISYTMENMQAVASAYPDKQLIIGEAGWATHAIEFGERASVAKQQQYFDDLYDWGKANHVSVFWFEAFDENWKGNPNNPDGAEKHWGLYNSKREKK